MVYRQVADFLLPVFNEIKYSLHIYGFRSLDKVHT